MGIRVLLLICSLVLCSLTSPVIAEPHDAGAAVVTTTVDGGAMTPELVATRLDAGVVDVATDGGMPVATSTVSPAPALAVPSPESDMHGFLLALYRAATSGQWKLLAGLALLGLTYATRRWVVGRVAWFKTALGGLTLAFALSLATTFGVALAVGASITLALALNAFATAATAAGFWQWVQKFLKAPSHS